MGDAADKAIMRIRDDMGDSSLQIEAWLSASSRAISTEDKIGTLIQWVAALQKEVGRSADDIEALRSAKQSG